ncbi:hypothetical protein MKK58_15950 [Methylobacterium sp. J-078]|uniref:hypothetical protein n=1 Tax=Methylobacterium sp. J-078 TaxID=2836657 RepID=UPI001FB92020|nr:hypothetical protein [Methylobacterium sp. J-078]MCJ2046009.1 hypothetical protein [Methylobacterium sp. J-078]
MSTAGTARPEIALAGLGFVGHSGSLTARSGTRCQVRRGAIHAVIGPNGVAKSKPFALRADHARKPAVAAAPLT